MRYISESDATERYNEFLDEVYGQVSVAGITWDTSRVLAELDPIAYRCGFNDWLDSESLTTDKSEDDSGEYDGPDAVTCGHCGKSFPDIYPSARCPFEYEHEDAEDDEYDGHAGLKPSADCDRRESGPQLSDSYGHSIHRI